MRTGPEGARDCVRVCEPFHDTLPIMYCSTMPCPLYCYACNLSTMWSDIHIVRCGQDHESRPVFTGGENQPAGKNPAPPQKNPSWMVPGPRGMILGQGGVVRDGLSGLEDGCDLFESCAALGRLLGRHTSRQARRRRRSVALRKNGFGANISIFLVSACQIETLNNAGAGGEGVQYHDDCSERPEWFRGLVPRRSTETSVAGPGIIQEKCQFRCFFLR